MVTNTVRASKMFRFSPLTFIVTGHCETDDVRRLVLTSGIRFSHLSVTTSLFCPYPTGCVTSIILVKYDLYFAGLLWMHACGVISFCAHVIRDGLSELRAFRD